MKLGVNIDHIATLRQARRGLEPEPAFAALIAENSVADSIVAHLREDRRHINEGDLYILRETVRTKLNLEMSAADEIIRFACKVKPDQATLVPEKRTELTTEGGLDVAANFLKVKKAVDKLNSSGIEVSLFIDPIKTQIDAAKKSGAGSVELHTGSYANAKSPRERKRHLSEIKLASVYANSGGLSVFAGHGLDYLNVRDIIKIREIEELNIGFSIISRAVFVGIGQAVSEMKELIS